MKCQGCGHDYPATITRCTNCGRLTPRRNRTSISDSRLIEFPKQTRPRTNGSPGERSLPAWRAELSERVKEIKAKRQAAESGELAPSGLGHVQRQTVVCATPAIPAPERDLTLTVEAALARVRRGQSRQSAQPQESRGTNSVTLGRIDPSPAFTASQPSPSSATPSHSSSRASSMLSGSGRAALAVDLAIERQPAVKPLDPLEYAAGNPQPRILEHDAGPRSSVRRTLEHESLISSTRDARGPRGVSPALEMRAASSGGRPAGQAAVEQNLAPVQSDAGAVQPRDCAVAEPEPAPAQSSTKPQAHMDAGESFEAIEEIDDIGPLDYLEAEVRKVDRELARNHSTVESAPITCRLVSGVVDLLAIAVSGLPFMLMVVLMKGSFSAPSTQLASGVIVGLVALFYLALTESLCGKTFGMMFTSTRVVAAGTNAPPATAQVLLRAIGHLLALAPAGLGLIWIVIDREGRAWQDLISQTMVVRDF